VHATGEALKLWAKYSVECGGIVDAAGDVAQGAALEEALVILKPDNFRFASARPGLIIDIFSRSGLRIVGAKIHRMTVAEAEEFYGPVRDVLREKLKGMVAERAAKAVAAELGMEIPKGQGAARRNARAALRRQPVLPDRPVHDRALGRGTGGRREGKPGTVHCLLLVYAGTQRHFPHPQHPRAHRSQQGAARVRPPRVRPGHHGQCRARLRFRRERPARNGHHPGREDSIRAWVEAYYP
jgi:hypothetical protein